MPRTKRPKRGRPQAQKEIELDPNIVIKQEPEDPPLENMEFEDDTNVNPDKDNLLPASKTVQVNTPEVYSIKQLRKLGDDLCKQERKAYDQMKQAASTAINVIKMKIPPNFRNVSIADVIQKQGLKPNGSNDLLSISQQIGNDTTFSVEQTNKTVSNDLQKEYTIGDNDEVFTMNRFKTPAVGLPTPRNGIITPKVGPNSPITILRRPKLGEVVVSMKGSPVMLNAAREDKPTLNIPMNNGTVMSILPEKGLRNAHLPQEIGPETRDHLKAIMENLKDLIVKSETPRP